MPSIDLNADLGESFGSWSMGDDAAMLDIVSSANVACGFHAGDPLTMRRTCELAQRHGCAIGAQVSYPDLVGFGRRFMDMQPADLEATVLYQLGALDAFARVAGTSVRYVKPHGALYNAIVTHEAQAQAVVAAVRAYDPTLPILGLPGSAVETVQFVREGFADRSYTAEGTLVPRTQPGALILEPSLAAAQAVQLAGDDVQSICVHSDTPGAPALLSAVAGALAAAGYTVQPFVR